ncbi:hypothetical protein Pelo_52 [Pelomyxa schiedti]|nr:hypothetical protein Pelo_52 [Pelomyxa schiedti]
MKEATTFSTPTTPPCSTASAAPEPFAVRRARLCQVSRVLWNVFLPNTLPFLRTPPPTGLFPSPPPASAAAPPPGAGAASAAPPLAVATCRGTQPCFVPHTGQCLWAQPRSADLVQVAALGEALFTLTHRAANLLVAMLNWHYFPAEESALRLCSTCGAIAVAREILRIWTLKCPPPEIPGGSEDTDTRVPPPWEYSYGGTKSTATLLVEDLFNLSLGGGSLEFTKWVVCSNSMSRSDAFKSDQYNCGPYRVINTCLCNRGLATAQWLADEAFVPPLEIDEIFQGNASMLAINSAEIGDFTAFQWAVKRFNLLSTENGKLLPKTAFLRACIAGHAEFAEEFVKVYEFNMSERPECINILNENCKAGRLQFCQWMVQFFKLTEEEVKYNSFQALEVALENKHHSLARWLCDTYGLATTPPLSILRRACFNGDVEFACYVATKWGITPAEGKSAHNLLLRHSCEKQHLAVAQWVTEFFSLKESDARAKGNQPLWKSCANGDVDTCKWLVERFKITRGEARIMLRKCVTNGRSDLSTFAWLVEHFGLEDEFTPGTPTVPPMPSAFWPPEKLTLETLQPVFTFFRWIPHAKWLLNFKVVEDNRDVFLQPPAPQPRPPHMSEIQWRQYASRYLPKSISHLQSILLTLVATHYGAYDDGCGLAGVNALFGTRGGDPGVEIARFLVTKFRMDPSTPLLDAAELLQHAACCRRIELAKWIVEWFNMSRLSADIALSRYGWMKEDKINLYFTWLDQARPPGLLTPLGKMGCIIS